VIALRKVFMFFLVLFTIIVLGAGLEISKKISVVILPAKVSHSWLEGDVDFLLSMLEEAMTNLGRFEVYSRAHVKEIMKERGLAEMGITDVEAEELGKLAGAQYVILLTLNDLKTGSKDGKYWASAQLSIRLLDISDGRIVASKPVDYNTGSYYENSEKAKKALFDYVETVFVQTMREFFKIKATVVKVEGSKAYLSGVDPSLLKVGMIFEVKGGLGKVGYVKLTSEENGLVVADVLYGYVAPGLEAKEMPMVGGGGAIALSYYMGFLEYTTENGEDIHLNPFGIGMVAWNGLYVEASYIAGSVVNYVPFDTVIGMRFDLPRFGRFFPGVHAGADIFGIYDTEKDDVIFAVFGASAGIDARYEFNPQSGVFGKFDYKYILGLGGFHAASIGYYIGF
jgi:hypothetical protein